MSTPAQIAANQKNAQSSTGPSSVEGKANSRFNALKHGISANSLIIPGESEQQLESLTREYFQDCRPRGPRQIMLVDTMIRADWHVRRLDRIEAQVVALLMDKSLPQDEAVARVYAEPAGKNNPLPFLFRRRAAAQRDWFRAGRELDCLKKEALENPQPLEEIAVPDATLSSPEPATIPSVPDIGFVPPMPLPVDAAPGPTRTPTSSNMTK